MAQTLPDPFYYLNNFRLVLDWIRSRHADLLDESEWSFVTTFPTLPQAAQALLVRMVMRQGERFRQTGLNYPEIGDPGAAVPALTALGWVDANPLLTLEQLFALLRKIELAAAFGLTARAASARKAELLSQLSRDFGSEARPLAGWCPGLDEHILALRVDGLCERLRLLFFGNLHQDWSEFVLADLGIFRYETVPLPADSRAFQRRSDVDDYVHLYRCRERLEAGEDYASLLAAIPATPHPNPWLEGRRARLLFRLGQRQEKLGDWPGALTSYAGSAYPGARARTIRTLERSGQSGAALALAETAWQAPESEEEQQQLQRMLPRLRRREGQAKAPAASSSPPHTLALTIAASDTDPVESLVREHVAAADAPVFYVENALINSLFGLLCWPALFAPLPGAFFHPFQQRPADLYAPDFYARRKELFADCLRQLEEGRHADTIERRFHEKFGLQSPFVYWGVLDENLLKLALDCIPPAHLRLFFERLLRDLKANHSGLPDLIQFWPAQRRYRMIEVKGPGDRLQDNQKRWLAYFDQHAIPVTVAYVQWATPA